MKRTIVSILFGVIALTAPLQADDAKSDKAKFLDAFKAYRAAVEANAGPDRVLQHAQEAVDYGKRVLSPTGKSWAQILLNLGNAQLGQDPIEAAETLKNAVDVYEAAYGEGSEATLVPRLQLVRALRASEEFVAANKEVTRVTKTARSLYEDPSAELGSILLNIGRLKMQGGVAPDADRYLSDALTIFERLGDPGAASSAVARFELGLYAMAYKKFKDAVTNFEGLAPELEQLRGNTYITQVRHAMLVRAYEELGQSDKATEHCRALGAMAPIDPNQDYLPVYQRPPEYPVGAQRMGQEGYVIVKLTVDDAGFTRDMTVIENSGSGSFKKAALDAASKFRYAPRHVDGKPVATPNVLYRFTFDLVG